MNSRIVLYIFVMAAVTYLIRVLPFILLRREIKSKFIRSFLYYVPYATLAAMTFPAVLYATGSVFVGGAALVVAVLLAWFGKSLFVVSASACVTALAAELLLTYLPQVMK